MTRLALLILSCYRVVLGPLLHAAVPAKSGCRFAPSCSEYLADAVRTRGLFTGLCRGFIRILHCHA